MADDSIEGITLHTDDVEKLAAKPLARDVLTALTDQTLVEVVFARLFCLLPNNTRQWRKTLNGMPYGRKLVFLVVGMDGEVGNGGFNQYFYNSSAYADDLPEALDRLGALEHSDIVRRAIKTFFKELHMQQQVRKEGTLEAFFGSYGESKLGSLDDEYFRLGERTDLTQLLSAYIRSHLEDFVETQAPGY